MKITKRKTMPLFAAALFALVAICALFAFGAPKQATAHACAVEFTVDKQPTLTEKGSKSKHCTNCDAKTEVTEIPMLRAQLVKPAEDGEGDEVVVSSPEGFSADIELVVTEIARENYSQYEEAIADENGVIGFVYDVSLRSDGVAIQPSGIITVKLRIPQNLIGKPFKVYHMHGNTATSMTYTTDGTYVVVATDSLSAFVFVGEKTTAPPETGLSGGVIACIVIFSVLGVLLVLYAVGLVLYLKGVIDRKICKVLYFYAKKRNKAPNAGEDGKIVQEMAEHAIEIDDEQVTEIEEPTSKAPEENGEV